MVGRQAQAPEREEFQTSREVGRERIQDVLNKTGMDPARFQTEMNQALTKLPLFLKRDPVKEANVVKDFTNILREKGKTDPQARELANRIDAMPKVKQAAEAELKKNENLYKITLTKEERTELTAKVTDYSSYGHVPSKSEVSEKMKTEFEGLVKDKLHHGDKLVVAHVAQGELVKLQRETSFNVPLDTIETSQIVLNATNPALHPNLKAGKDGTLKGSDIRENVLREYKAVLDEKAKRGERDAGNLAEVVRGQLAQIDDKKKAARA